MSFFRKRSNKKSELLTPILQTLVNNCCDESFGAESAAGAVEELKIKLISCSKPEFDGISITLAEFLQDESVQVAFLAMSALESTMKTPNPEYQISVSRNAVKTMLQIVDQLKKKEEVSSPLFEHILLFIQEYGTKNNEETREITEAYYHLQKKGWILWPSNKVAQTGKDAAILQGNDVTPISSASVFSTTELKGMKPKMLKQIMETKGISQAGCAEKDDFINKILDHQFEIL